MAVVNEEFSIAIQAGGKSSRMGQDKGLLSFRGQPLIGYILEQLIGFGSETFIISNQPEDYRSFGFPVFSDTFPGKGPIGGIYTAISHAKNDICLVLACDMPIINRDLLTYLLSALGEFDVVMPRTKTDDYSEPFRAYYRKSCLAPILNSIERDDFGVISFLDAVKVNYIRLEDIIKYDPYLLSFTNINTPEELIDAERLAIKYEKSKRK